MHHKEIHIWDRKKRSCCPSFWTLENDGQQTKKKAVPKTAQDRRQNFFGFSDEHVLKTTVVIRLFLEFSDSLDRKKWIEKTIAQLENERRRGIRSFITSHLKLELPASFTWLLRPSRATNSWVKRTTKQCINSQTVFGSGLISIWRIKALRHIPVHLDLGFLSLSCVYYSGFLMRLMPNRLTNVWFKKSDTARISYYANCSQIKESHFLGST